MPPATRSLAEHIARQVKTKRKILRLSQTELATRVGTSQTAIARIEAAHGNPTLGLIQRLSNALDLTLLLTVQPQSETRPTPGWLKE